MNTDLGQRIVAGVHGSAASHAALRWAAREAALRHSALHVVRAWEDETRQAAPYAPRFRVPGMLQHPRRAGIRLEDEVRAVAGDPAGLMITCEVVEGLPARVLIDRSAGAELLVVGSAAGSGPDALGPVARACLLCAACPVVVVSLKSAGVPARV